MFLLRAFHEIGERAWPPAFCADGAGQRLPSAPLFFTVSFALDGPAHIYRALRAAGAEVLPFAALLSLRFPQSGFSMRRLFTAGMEEQMHVFFEKTEPLPVLSFPYRRESFFSGTASICAVRCAGR
jgi:hypothetical protein